MKPKIQKDCKINDMYYAKGDEIEVQNKEQLLKLVEKGFVEPLTPKQIQDYFNKPNKKED